MDLTLERRQYQPDLPHSLQDITDIDLSLSERPILPLDPHNSQKYFPHTAKQPLLLFSKGSPKENKKLKIGVVLSGGPAPGGHSVIAGIFDGLQQLHPDNQLLGFLSGPQGLIDGRYEILSQEKIDEYRHTGGFDLLGSGRTKIEQPEQFESVKGVVKSLHLDGIIIIGGDDSNTNAAVLAEYFRKEGIETCVIGVPKTIDGDLCNEFVEISFGFDTATKVYSQLISNLTKDAKSAEKYYHFVKIMGRSASHVALECALQVQPNMTLISEEIIEKQISLNDVVSSIVEMIVTRAKEGINYGVVVLPEGLIEAIHEIAALIKEINEKGISREKFNISSLSPGSQKLFSSFPDEIQKQLLLERDPHGNVQVSLIPTEKLMIHLVSEQLALRKKEGTYQGKFQPMEHFFGYEGRCSFPSNFDVAYCYSLGKAACALIDRQKTGYMVGIKNLVKSPSFWEVYGVPIASLINLEKRHGVMKPVIKKYLVDLKGKPFKYFANSRSAWAVRDEYKQVLPMQFFGPHNLTELRPKILTISFS